MKLATLKSSLPDGDLVVVSKDNRNAVKVVDIVPNMKEALENWNSVEGALVEKYNLLNKGNCPDSFEVSPNQLHAAMPRSYQFADGSAYIQHIILVRKARNAEPPETLQTVPLMYQAVSDMFLAPNDNIPQVDFAHGTDFEAEVGVIVDRVPMGTSAEEALKHIRLVLLINDVSLRGLIPAELKSGFGFFHGKPNSALSPLAVTIDELGDDWRDGRVHLPICVDYNGEKFGRANAGEMHFHFGELIAHAAKTRPLMPGTIIGSGTVANEDLSNGSSCLVERRMIEKIETGEMKTPFMKVGDKIKIEMLNSKNESIFGVIEQKVVQA